MKIVSIILARGASKGLKNKNILNFCGKPLIVHSIEASLQSKLVNKTYVSSDCNNILDISLNHGAVGIKRPQDYALDDSPSELALMHFLSVVEEKPDLVVFLQPTSPLRTAQDIDEIIETLLRDNLDSVFSACKAEDLCLWKVFQNDLLESFSYDHHHRKRRQEFDKMVIENGSIYVFKPAVLQNHNNRLGGKIGYHLLDSWKVFEIDNIFDFELCEFIYDKRM